MLPIISYNSSHRYDTVCVHVYDHTLCMHVHIVYMHACTYSITIYMHFRMYVYMSAYCTIACTYTYIHIVENF